MRRLALVLAISLTACGGDDDGGGDSSDGDVHGHEDGGVVADATAGPDAPPPSADCQDYCSSIMATCTMALAQYRDTGDCLASCAVFSPGEPGADSGDSLACRITHAELAVGEPDPHCRHAGPSGGGVCGAYCEAYCTLVMGICSEVYADAGECMTTCADFPVSGMYSVKHRTGDTVDCRIFHTTLAPDEPEVHCTQVGPDSIPCSAQ